MAVTDMFCQPAVIEFLVKEGNSAAVIYGRLRVVYGDVCMGVSSVRRWVKHFKDGNTDIVDYPRCGRTRTARPRSEADHSPSSSVEVKNAWSYNPTSIYVFMAWCLIKHSEKFTLILPSTSQSSSYSYVFSASSKCLKIVVLCLVY
jgi:hypothetical protein